MSTQKTAPSSAPGAATPLHNGAVLCFCNSNRVWGGGENWHLQAARYFAGQGHQVFVAAGAQSALGLACAKLIAGSPALAARLHLHDWRFGNLDFLNPVKTWRFAAWLRENGVTHLIAGLPADLKGGAIAARKLHGAVKLFYRRGSALPVKPSLSNRYFYGALSGLIVNSQATGRCVLQAPGLIDPQKVHIIHNAVDIAGFDARLQAQEGAAPAPAQAPFAEGGDCLVIGNAGRLNAQKGQKYLLAMSAALAAHGVKHRLVIAGSGELLDPLQAQAGALGLSCGFGLNCDAQVCFTGFMENMAPFWQGIDVFVLSSLWEGFGYVLAEAMLAQKAVFAFNCNSMPELVQEGQNGFLIPPPQEGESVNAVGERMAQTLINAIGNKENLLQLGRNGRRFCEDNFAEPLLMQQLAQVLFVR